MINSKYRICPECSSKLKKIGANYICPICGYENSVEEFDLEMQNELDDMAKFKQEVDARFRPLPTVSNHEIEELIEKQNCKFKKLLDGKDASIQKLIQEIQENQRIYQEAQEAEAEAKRIDKEKASKEESFEEEYISIDECLSRKDYRHLADDLYFAVEDYLMTQLSYKNSKFIISQEEFNGLCKKSSEEEGESCLVYWDKINKVTKPITLNRPVLTDSNGIVYYEMTPVVRFYAQGLSNDKAKQAGEYWSVINKIRHQSEESKKYIDKKFKNKTLKQKYEYFERMVNFFKEIGFI